MNNYLFNKTVKSVDLTVFLLPSAFYIREILKKDLLKSHFSHNMMKSIMESKGNVK